MIERVRFAIPRRMKASFADWPSMDVSPYESIDIPVDTTIARDILNAIYVSRRDYGPDCEKKEAGILLGPIEVLKLKVHFGVDPERTVYNDPKEPMSFMGLPVFCKRTPGIEVIYQPSMAGVLAYEVEGR